MNQRPFEAVIQDAICISKHKNKDEDSELKACDEILKELHEHGYEIRTRADYANRT